MSASSAACSLEEVLPLVNPTWMPGGTARRSTKCAVGRFEESFEEKVSLNIHNAMAVATSLLFNLQRRRRAGDVGKRHYDVGNDFFECMLDPAMQYSCAWFRETDDLAQAQREKMDLICRKLGLQKGMRLLDMGCGWGGLAKHAAEHYGCRVVGITISEQQRSYAAKSCQRPAGRNPLSRLPCA